MTPDDYDRLTAEHRAWRSQVLWAWLILGALALALVLLLVGVAVLFRTGSGP